MHTQFNSTQQSRFSTICETISNANPINAMLIPALLGCGMVVLGLFLEYHGQSYLIKQGSDAIINYYTSIDTDLNLVQYIGHALQWQLNSFGGNQQGIGMAILGTTPVFGLAVFV
jgi:hypothetical protein